MATSNTRTEQENAPLLNTPLEYTTTYPSLVAQPPQPRQYQPTPLIQVAHQEVHQESQTYEEPTTFVECERCHVLYCNKHMLDRTAKAKRIGYKCLTCKGKTRSNTKRKWNIVGGTIFGTVVGSAFLLPGAIIGCILGYYYVPSRKAIPDRTCDKCAICFKKRSDYE